MCWFVYFLDNISQTELCYLDFMILRTSFIHRAYAKEWKSSKTKVISSNHKGQKMSKVCLLFWEEENRALGFGKKKYGSTSELIGNPLTIRTSKKVERQAYCCDNLVHKPREAHFTDIRKKKNSLTCGLILSEIKSVVICLAEIMGKRTPSILSTAHFWWNSLRRKVAKRQSLSNTGDIWAKKKGCKSNLLHTIICLTAA